EVLRRGLVRGGAANGEQQGGAEGSIKMADELLEKARLRVMANEIDPSGSGRLSRTRGAADKGEYRIHWPEGAAANQKPGLWTAKHKLDVMRAVLEQLYGESDIRADGWDGMDGRNRVCSVYVGDSPTDLMCLIEADVGICIRDDEAGKGEQVELKDALERCAVRCLPITEYRSGNRGLEGECGKTLWWAKDFHEIEDALFQAGQQ
ncbi:MAG: hypothetical protein LQ340_008049, partial [Diploschistes diacapsis]